MNQLLSNGQNKTTYSFIYTFNDWLTARYRKYSTFYFLVIRLLLSTIWWFAHLGSLYHLTPCNIV